MKNYVIYLYEYMGKNTYVSNEESKHFKKLESHPLVALDTQYIKSSNDIKLKTKPLEIMQLDFQLFIKQAEILNVDITKVEFTDEVDIELLTDFEVSLEKQEFKRAFNLLKIIKEENVDVSAISFIHDNNPYRITKYAIVEVLGESFTEAVHSIEYSPLNFIIGLNKFPK